jgi:hypothetical protein
MFINVDCGPHGLVVATSYDGIEWRSSSNVIPYRVRTRRLFFFWKITYTDPKRDRAEYLQSTMDLRKVSLKENQSTHNAWYDTRKTSKDTPARFTGHRAVS